FKSKDNTLRTLSKKIMIKRILVLDDNQDILDIVKEALSYEKFEVNITSDAKRILETIKIFGPDLVIVDHKLNGYNGDDICREIKASARTNDIPVIICSAYLNGDDDLWGCGCDAIIAKPFGLEELIDKVNGLIAV
ncbi:MAG: response regulator transcription factor, partial [Sphingobacteriales bacterium]